MEKDVTVWCIEAPQGNLLKEITIHDEGNRLLFTNQWDDGAMKFGMKTQAEKLKRDYHLIWLEVTEHVIMGGDV